MKIHLWTDGSSINSGKGQGNGGYGFVLLVGKFENVDISTEYGDKKRTVEGYGSSTDTTNQREEMKAVIEGLRKIKDNKYRIEIYSDSAYIINCMNDKWYVGWKKNGWKNSKKEPVANKDLWEDMLDMIESKKLDVGFNKVKGHSKIHYNERCDVLARQGLDEALSKHEESDNIPKYKGKVKDRTEEMFEVLMKDCPYLLKSMAGYFQNGFDHLTIEDAVLFSDNYQILQDKLSAVKRYVVELQE